MKLTVLLFILASACYVSAENDTLERNRTLHREIRELQLRQNKLLDQADRLKETKSTLETTRDLISGKLAKPPACKERKTVQYRFEDKEPKVLDNTETKKRLIIERWLKLTPGKTYLFEGMVKLEHSKGTKNIKFGCFVPVKGGKTQWPGCGIGTGSFDWRKCGFQYKVPQGAAVCLVYGFENGYGKVLFKDITVSELD